MIADASRGIAAAPRCSSGSPASRCSPFGEPAASRRHAGAPSTSRAPLRACRGGHRRPAQRLAVRTAASKSAGGPSSSSDFDLSAYWEAKVEQGAGGCGRLTVLAAACATPTRSTARQARHSSTSARAALLPRFRNGVWSFSPHTNLPIPPHDAVRHTEKYGHVLFLRVLDGSHESMLPVYIGACLCFCAMKDAAGSPRAFSNRHPSSIDTRRRL